jgi:hypothetical protein
LHGAAVRTHAAPPSLSPHSPPPQQALLDAILLEAYPRLAALAPLSDRCAALTLQLAAAAASACAPRDALTVLLEQMDALLNGGPDDSPMKAPGGGGGAARMPPAALLAGVVPLLPSALARLQRRRCNFLSECLGPVASAAKAVGAALRGAHSGNVSGAGAAFAARQTGAFADFVADAERGALASAATAGEDAGATREGLARLTLQLLAYLTLGFLGAGDKGPGGGAGAGGACVQGQGSRAGDGVMAGPARRLVSLLVELGIGDWQAAGAAAQVRRLAVCRAVRGALACALLSESCLDCPWAAAGGTSRSSAPRSNAAPLPRGAGGRGRRGGCGGSARRRRARGTLFPYTGRGPPAAGGTPCITKGELLP